MINVRSGCWLVLLTLLGAGSRSQAAYTTLYSDVTTFSGNAYAGGGATSLGGNVTTAMIADDITVAAGLGGSAVNQISFSTANLNTVAVTTSIELYLYAGNGPGGGPGSVLTTITFAPLSLAAGSVQIFTYTSTSSIFTMPSTLFWAGISFSNNFGTTGATAAQLNELGAGLFGPPTVGSSLDLFFKSTAATTNGATNPAGGFFYFGGSPVADFGFAFAGTPPVPEPSSAILFGIGMIACVGAARRHHRSRRVRSTLDAGSIE